MKPLPVLKHTIDVRGRRVLLRLDLNVPLVEEDGVLRVADDTRIREELPAIVRLRHMGARIIVVAHLGDPKGKVVAKMRLAPVVENVRRQLGLSESDVQYARDWNFAKLAKTVTALQEGQVLILENVRFEAGEEANDPTFAKALAGLADLYINEAFSVSHRAHASVSRICEFLPHYAGWRLAEEVETLSRLRTRAAEPFVLMVGGAKVDDKIGMMIELAPHASAILVGGVAANTILQLQGVPVGASHVDDEPPAAMLKNLLAEKRTLAGKQQPLMYVPCDVLMARRGSTPARVVGVSGSDKVNAKDVIVDIGPATMRLYAAVLKKAKTIVWNGPLGLIEDAQYRHGSVALARLIAARSQDAYTVVGGGETLEALRLAGVSDDIDFRSTGGGAMLALLGGKSLPGLEALSK